MVYYAINFCQQDLLNKLDSNYGKLSAEEAYLVNCILFHVDVHRVDFL